MSTPVAIMIGALVIGGAVLLSGRYAIAVDPNKPFVALWRLDRLTGAVSYCGASDGKAQCISATERTSN